MVPRTWKIYGPDKNGGYGGLQGIGGLEATIQEGLVQVAGPLHDYFGNVVVMVDPQSGAVTPSSVSFSGYGPLTGNSLSLLSPAVSLAQAIGWRGKRMDPTGFYYLGARYYERKSARFLLPTH